MKCSIISSRPLGVFSSRFFVFKFIVHALPTLYTYHPSLNKLYKTFIKVMKMSRLRKSVIDLKKMYPKKTYIRSIRSSGVGKCFFLRAQGWGIDHQETKNLANPRSMPRRHGNRSKLNHALLVYRDLNCLHGFCIKEVCNVKLWINTLYYSTIMSFYHIRSRGQAKYEAVIHRSVLV